MAAERFPENHRPQEAHLQAVAGRVRRAGSDRARLPQKSLRRSGIRARRRAQGKLEKHD